MILARRFERWGVRSSGECHQLRQIVCLVNGFGRQSNWHLYVLAKLSSQSQFATKNNNNNNKMHKIDGEKKTCAISLYIIWISMPTSIFYCLRKNFNCVSRRQPTIGSYTENWLQVADVEFCGFRGKNPYVANMHANFAHRYNEKKEENNWIHFCQMVFMSSTFTHMDYINNKSQYYL